jgi:hypothetical protein
MMMSPARMYGLEDITVLVINYRTLDLTERCLSSLRLHYPQVRLLVTDNGSADESTAYIQGWCQADPYAQAVLHPHNLHHGPALHHALRAIRTPLAFTLDSDCQVLQGGFLEGMLAAFTDPRTYAVGRLVYMNRFGYELEGSPPGATAYIHPYAMLLHREKYTRLKPFTHHGSPALANMRSAGRAGWRLVDYPLQGFIYHQGRGTCSRHGYDLGWRHVVEYLLDRWLKTKW